MQTLPEAVTRLADVRELGRLRVVAVGADGSGVAYVAGAVPVSLVLGWWLLRRGAWLPGLGLLWAIPLLCWIYFQMRGRRRVYCFDRGLVLANGMVVRGYLWPEVVVTRMERPSYSDEPATIYVDIEERDGTLVARLREDNNLDLVCALASGR